MIASTGPSRFLTAFSEKDIPNVLIHEIIDGKPFDRKGYPEVGFNRFQESRRSYQISQMAGFRLE